MTGRSSTPRPIELFLTSLEYWIPAFAGMTTLQTGLRDLAARFARALLEFSLPPKSEGAGNTGCALHPRSRVQNCALKHAHEHTGSAETLRHSLRSGFTAYLYRALPGVPSLIATVIGGALTANLTPASGCQDHTTSPSASRAFVKGAFSGHRSPFQRSKTIASAPLGGTGWLTI